MLLNPETLVASLKASKSTLLTVPAIKVAVVVKCRVCGNDATRTSPEYALTPPGGKTKSVAYKSIDDVWRVLGTGISAQASCKECGNVAVLPQSQKELFEAALRDAVTIQWLSAEFDRLVGIPEGVRTSFMSFLDSARAVETAKVAMIAG